MKTRQIGLFLNETQKKKIIALTPKRVPGETEPDNA